MASATTFAVKGTARTAEGVAPKTYTSKGGTKAEAEGMLAELQDVQQASSLPRDAEIVTLNETSTCQHPTSFNRYNLPATTCGAPAVLHRPDRLIVRYVCADHR